MEPQFLNLLHSRKPRSDLFENQISFFLLPERYVTDHKGMSMKGLSGSELRPEVLSDN